MKKKISKKRNRESFSKDGRNNRRATKSPASERPHYSLVPYGGPPSGNSLGVKCSICDRRHKDADCRHVIGPCYKCGAMNHQLA